MYTMHGLGSASAPVAAMSASGELETDSSSHLPFGQACQHLKLVVDHDGYQRFTFVSPTMLRPSS